MILKVLQNNVLLEIFARNKIHRHSREGGNPAVQKTNEINSWIPAFAGMTK